MPGPNAHRVEVVERLYSRELPTGCSMKGE
jgi:hypothetical protein